MNVKLNEGLQVIGARAFNGCVALRSVTVPSSVTKLVEHAFCGCTDLVELQLGEGLQVIGQRAFYDCVALRSVAVPSSVTKLGGRAFYDCMHLVELRLNEGLQIIGYLSFSKCTGLQSVAIPSTVSELGGFAFCDCFNLAKVQLNEGLQTIGEYAFAYCLALRSVTIPETVTELGGSAFSNCSDLSEVILSGDRRLLNQEFLARGRFSEEQGLLLEAIDEILFDDDRNFAFRGCPLTTIKISITRTLSERMARLLPKCRVSVEERIRNLPCLDLTIDGNVLACFPVVERAQDDDAEDGSDSEAEDNLFGVQDINLETARSLYRVLQLIAYHELKESSILIELAV